MTDEYYIEQHGMTRKEYFREYYNEVSCLTAKCIRNKSELWVREDYSELEIGKTYKVTLRNTAMASMLSWRVCMS